MQNVQIFLRDEKIMSISMIGEAAGRGVINLRMGRGKIASTLTFIDCKGRPSCIEMPRTSHHRARLHSLLFVSYIQDFTELLEIIC